MTVPEKPVSEELEEWLGSGSRRTIGSLLDRFDERCFAMVFIVLAALPAVPAPTGAVSHVLLVVMMLLALELVCGRRELWLPDRLRRRQMGGASGSRFVTALLRPIRWLEGHSRPRAAGLLRRRASTMVFGLIVLALALTAFFAPPFSGLDTLPAVGIVLVSLGFLLDDSVLATAGVVVGGAGLLLVLWLGKHIVDWASGLF